MVKLSVIIPVGPNEDSHSNLLKDLECLPDDVEIIVEQSSSRAQALNSGAAKAKGEFLWFLHADSKVTEEMVPRLFQLFSEDGGCLFYFDLKFYDKWMKINEIGAFLRSRLFGVPFGDQGFCIARNLFEKVGGYPVDVSYGEDHLFVWMAKRVGVKLHPVGLKIGTSARKYKEVGWFKLTCMYQFMWIKQAFPFLLAGFRK